MPGISRGHKAEAKYNVTLDFPHLGLHSAASSGDIGLVKYALEHGQPINSALDGVLPLHAACSGGSDIVVRLLIDRGADVNAPRLPRRYSSDKNRDTTAPIVGTSGSTPLHFACANGHINVVLTLLLHGAHPDRPDKHGVTPEMLARQNGFSECADVLKQWSHNKDKDLRDREDRISRAYSDNPPSHPIPSTHNSNPNNHTSDDPSPKESHHYCGQLDCKDCSNRKRLRVKQSIDNALHIFRPSLSISSTPVVTPPSAGASTSSGTDHTRDSTTHPSSSTSTSVHTAARPSPSPTTNKPLGEYSFYPSPPESSSLLLMQDYPRRPSLPHLFEHVQRNGSQRRPSGFASATRVRRPRSAGTGAEISPSRGTTTTQIQSSYSHPPAHHSSLASIPSSSGGGSGTGTLTSTPNKVKSKLSLLNIFKKSSSDAYGSTPESGYTSTSSNSASPSPAPDQPHTHPYAHSQSHSHTQPSTLSQSHLSSSQSTTTLALGASRSVSVLAQTTSRTSSLPSPRHKRSVDALTHTHTPESVRFRNRLASEGGMGKGLPTQAVELHHALSRDSLRGQFHSQQPQPQALAQEGSAQGVRRPGILKAHGRSGSGNSQSPSPSRPIGQGITGERAVKGDGSPSPNAHPLSLSHSSSQQQLQQQYPYIAPQVTSTPGRALRFDSSSTSSSSRSRGVVNGREKSGDRRRGESQSPTRVLRYSTSGNSLKGVIHREPEDIGFGGVKTTSPTQIPIPAGKGSSVFLGHEGGSSPASSGGVIPGGESSSPVRDRDDIEEEEEEEEYGKVVNTRVGELSLEDNDLPENGKLLSLDTGEDSRNRSEVGVEGEDEEMLGSTPEEEPEGPLTHVFDCPFSINCPPPPVLEDISPAPPHTQHPFHSHHLLHQQHQHRPPLNHQPPLQTHQSQQQEYLGIETLEAQGRTRGDSMSSMITDTSSLGGLNPPSSSSTSGFIDTPAIEMEGLPIVDVSSPHSVPSDLIHISPVIEDEKKRFGVVEVEEAKASSPSDETEVLSSSPPRSDVAVVANDMTLRVVPHKRSRVPLDIDIRSISSHAQAEALVQAAQQRILDFENSPVEEEVEGVCGVSSGGLVSSMVGEGRTPLSARLAAYGESLSIERRFKEEEQEKKRRSPTASAFGFGYGGVGGTSIMSLSPKSGVSFGVSGVSPSASVNASQTRVVLSPSVREDGFGGVGLGVKKGRMGELGVGFGVRGPGLDRKFSLEERARVSSSGRRVRKVKRPHTAGGTPLSDPPSSIFAIEPTMHHHSSSFGAITTSSTSNLRASPSKQPRVLVASITPPSSNYLKVRAETFPTDRPSLPNTRSRTPDPSSPPDSSLININPNISISSIPPSDLFAGGAPLSRYSTAPDDVFCDERPGGRLTLTKEEREVARASKLTKMGFSSGGEAWQGNAGAGNSKTRHRFGGIRTLVQSLTGKS